MLTSLSSVGIIRRNINETRKYFFADNPVKYVEGERNSFVRNNEKIRKIVIHTERETPPVLHFPLRNHGFKNAGRASHDASVKDYVMFD